MGLMMPQDVDFNSSAIKESCGLDLERIVNDLDKAPGRSLSSPIRLKVIESHGDQVLTLPPGGVALASSSTAQCEMFSIPGVVLACQSHPEFPGSEVVLEKIHSALSSNGTLSPEEATASKDSLEKSQLDSQPVRLLIRSFMEGP